MTMQTRRAFWILFFSVFSAMLGVGIIGPLMPILAIRLGASGIALGLVFSGFSIARIVTMPLVGYQSDRLGKKRFIVLGLVLYSFISIGYVFSQTVLELIWLRVLHGMASAMVIPVAMAYAGEMTAKGEEGETMGTFSISTMAGLGVGPLLGGVLTDWLGETSAFLSLTFLAMVGATFAYLQLPESHPRPQRKKNRLIEDLRRALRKRKVIGVLWFRFIMTLARGTMISFFPIYAASLGISLAGIGFLLSVNMLLMSLLQKVIGRISDKLGRRLIFIMSGMLLGALSLGLIPFCHNFTQLLFLNLLMGFGGALAFPAAMALMVEHGRQEGMGSAMAYFNMALSMGMIVAPLFSGLIMDIWSIEAIFLVNGSLIASGMAVFYLLVRNEDKPIQNLRRIS